MTPAELSAAIVGAVRQAVDDGVLAVAVPDRITVERPKSADHGDYASNVALQLAKPAGKPPRAVAEALAERLRSWPGIGAVDVAGPGFLNFRLDQAALGELARTVVAAGSAYGTSATGAGERINLEFVSANPTGPIHIGGTRWAAVGDALARLLRATGAEVVEEYYFNDAGTQIDRFGSSLYAAAKGLPAPADGYGGGYVVEVAEFVAKTRPDALDLPPDEARKVFAEAGVERMFDEIKASLADFGVHFDVYFNERDLHRGAIEEAVERLRARGVVFEQDGAVWLRTTDFGDDKDRVLVKADGDTTYFAADLAYYLNKRDRGFDRCFLMLGADHHGYVGRMQAMVAAYGDTPYVNLEILIGQMVNLVQGGAAVRMSKRAGTIVTLEDLVEAVGVDAARYALVRSSVDSTLEIDLDLLTRRTNENPVFYVQYAHARLSSLARNAAEVGLARDGGEFRPELLVHDREKDLLGTLGEYPRVVASAAELREPHRVARYLEELAGVYHRFYDVCRVLPRGEEEITDLMRARLWLCEATRVVLANGLDLLGVSAPERM